VDCTAQATLEPSCNNPECDDPLGYRPPARGALTPSALTTLGSAFGARPIALDKTARAGAEGRTHRGLKEFCGGGGSSRGETRFNLAAIIDKRIPHFSRCST
jgi:hypothetical protein